MKLTKQLKAWLVENKGVDKDADDATFKSAATSAIVDGSLSAEKLLELTEEKEDKEANSLESKLDAILTNQQKTSDRLDKLEKGGTEPKDKAGETDDDKDGDDGDDKGAEGGKKGKLSDKAPNLDKDKSGPTYFEKLFAQGGGHVDYKDGDSLMVRVKGVDEMYDTTKKALHFPAVNEKGQKHHLAGQRVFEGGTQGRRPIDEPSELERAVCGSYFKMVTHFNMRGMVPAKLRMTEHDRQLLQYAMHEMKWGGVIGGVGDEDANSIGVFNRKLVEMERKGILDDAASGGLEIAPIAFDDAIITTPLLTGEFFPFVNLVNITRGRRIEGGSIGNPTLNSGGADGTAIPLFNTASFISAFDTNIHVVDGAIEIGLDFLSDSPVDVADIVTQRYALVLLNWLDEQCVLGDGTTEPEGVNVASGTVSVNAENGASGPPTVGDYEALLFGVPKQYKQGFATNRIRYGANETSYQRARSIAVGTTDARRVFGMTHEDYMLLSHPYSINAAIGNRAINFCNWGRYRMYRRLGMTMRVTTEGKELVRANQMLITLRARFGGQLEDGNACAVIADGQS